MENINPHQMKTHTIKIQMVACHKTWTLDHTQHEKREEVEEEQKKSRETNRMNMKRNKERSQTEGKEM